MTRLRILLPVIVAGLSSCRDQAPGPSWLVTTALSANEFSAGERLVVTVVARNISSEVQYVRNNACATNYLVLQPSGIRSPLPARYCLMIFIAPTAVAPGDSVVRSDSWDGSISAGYLKTVPAPPGVYLIEGRVFALEEVRGQARPVVLK